jgi:hypothetical protein
MLKKDIRKTLLETKEKKENVLIEQKIVENRIKSIFKNESDIKYFQGLPKKTKLRYSILLIKEIQELNNLGLINEQSFSFMDILKSLFGKTFGGIIETAAEPIINSILNAIGFKSDGFLKKFMISFLTSRPSELIKAFSDCKMMTKLLVESFTEGIVMMVQEDMNKGGFMYDTIRNVVGDMIKDTSIATKIETTIENKVCGLFGSFTDKAKDVADKLKVTQQTETQPETSNNTGGFLSGLFGK